MKLHAGINTIEKSGDFEESQFSIEASAKAFFILSDGLYSNKILAVVRELSTNAYDSHVDAGKKDVPFDVHLPSRFNPTFYIRDYGTSMSHEHCMELYTTYFRSTRNNSNDAVGCLGLGSKAPFAYGDSFIVEAYLDGTRRLYNAYKNEDGNPVFSLMDSGETNEANGIKVSISVNEYDIDRFVREARKVYEFFNVRPNFIGEEINYNTENKTLSGDNWYFDDNDDRNYIIMGQIAYPIDHSQIIVDDIDSSKKNSRFIEYSNGLRIIVNIGDVDITPSRESLSYSKQTKININNIISKILDDIATQIEHEIKSQPTLFKARSKYVQISDQCMSVKTAMESLMKSIVWNDQKLFDNIVSESIDIPNMTVKLFEKSSYRSKIDMKIDTNRIHFTDAVKFVVDDLPRGGISRTKQYIKEFSNNVACYFYKLGHEETVDNCRLYDILGGATKDDVVFTSNLPKVEYNRNSSGGNGGPMIQAQVFNEESGRFEECAMSVKYENAYYFTESKGKVNVSSASYPVVEIYYLEKILSYIHDNHNDEVEGKRFYIVKPSIAKNRKLDERSNWHLGYEFVRKILTDIIAENHQDIYDVMNRQTLSNQFSTRWVEVINMTKNPSVVKNVVSEYNEYVSHLDNICEKVEVIKQMANSFRFAFPGRDSNFEDNRFAPRFDKEMSKYKVLQVIRNVPYSDEDRQIMADYIDSIEQVSVLNKE
jgi:hypothetical protein